MITLNKSANEEFEVLDFERYHAQVVIAALNEQEGISPTIAELSANLLNPRIIVVDGYSHDRTVEVAKDQGAEIYFQKGKGKGDAISNSLKYLDPHIKYVVLTDADYTYPAEYLVEMIDILEENPNVGMVCGNRFTKQTQKGAWPSFFTLGNKFLALAHAVLNNVSLKDPLTGLRVIRTEILIDTTLKSKGFDIEVELNSQITSKGFKTVEVPIKYRTRLGEKKLKAKDGFAILRRICTEIIR
jgi:glycosyltransferase involved in cell wall biosynthesis